MDDNQKLSEDEINEQTIYSIETWQNLENKELYILGLVDEPHKEAPSVVIVMGSDNNVMDAYELLKTKPEAIQRDVIAEWKGVENMPNWQAYFSQFAKEIKSTYYREEALEELGIYIQKENIDD